MCKYTIFWTNKKENNKLYKIIIELPHIESVIEGIRDVIPYFNQRLAEEGSQFILSNDPNLYEFRKAKKSGLPKEDYPGIEIVRFCNWFLIVFDSNQILSQTCIQNIALVEKNPTAISQRAEMVNETTSAEKGNLSATMISTTMPGIRNVPGYQTMTEEDYVEETKCFCFKRIVKKKNKELNNDLNTQLLS